MKDPVNVTNAFALHTLVVAEMKLLETALKEERNQKFILLSESCIPIHPPEVIYAQVTHITLLLPQTSPMAPPLGDS